MLTKSFNFEEVTLQPTPFVTFDGAKTPKQNEKVRNLSFHMPDTQYKYLYASIKGVLKKIYNIEYKVKDVPKDFPDKIKDYVAMISYLYCKYYESFKSLVTSPTPLVIKPAVSHEDTNDILQLNYVKHTQKEVKPSNNVRIVTYNISELSEDKNFNFEEFNLVMMTSRIMVSHCYTSPTSINYVFNPKSSIIKKLENELSMVNSNVTFNLKQSV